MQLVPNSLSFMSRSHKSWLAKPLGFGLGARLSSVNGNLTEKIFQSNTNSHECPKYALAVGTVGIKPTTTQLSWQSIGLALVRKIYFHRGQPWYAIQNNTTGHFSPEYISIRRSVFSEKRKTVRARTLVKFQIVSLKACSYQVPIRT